MKVFVINGKLCKIDDEDAHFLEENSWCLTKGKQNYSWYIALGRRKGKYVQRKYLHRLVAKAVKGDRVAFVTSDTLDCRKDNLRLNGKRLK
jgi:hypothetical protein